MNRMGKVMIKSYKHIINLKYFIIIISLLSNSPIFAKEDALTIMAWAPCVNDDKPTIDDFKGVKYCGFNAALFHGEEDQIRIASDFAKKMGLDFYAGGRFLINPHKNEEFKRLKDKKGITGWFLVDEPWYSRLNAYKSYYDKLKILTPDKKIYINLIGKINPKYTGSNKTISEYLDTIQTMFNPDIWSYDLYPISLEGTQVKVDYTNFYSDLELFSKWSQISKKPFWAFCQSMAFKNERVERPAATVPYLRFEAFSALAYGAQGIVYWTYAHKTSNTENFLSALIDREGQKTSAWFAAKQVNSEIKAFNKVFIHSKVLDCKHTVMDSLNDSIILKGSMGPIESVYSGGIGFLISHIKSNGIYYIVIVNHDVVSNQSIGLTFGIKNMKHLSPVMINSKLIISEETLGETYNGIISPGGYMIIKYSKSNYQRQK